MFFFVPWILYFGSNKKNLWFVQISLKTNPFCLKRNSIWRGQLTLLREIHSFVVWFYFLDLLIKVLPWRIQWFCELPQISERVTGGESFGLHLITKPGSAIETAKCNSSSESFGDDEGIGKEPWGRESINKKIWLHLLIWF